MRISAAASALTARWRSRVPPLEQHLNTTNGCPTPPNMEAPGTRFSYLTAATSPRRQKPRLENQALGLGHCALEASLNVSPVHNVPECLDVLALNVLVVQVECVLPHI